ncbi:hypothetical protein JCM16358_25040 [Halanaerocella petrolearia]
MADDGFDIMEAFKVSWENIRDNFGKLVGPLLIWGVIFSLSAVTPKVNSLLGIVTEYVKLVVTLGVVNIILRLYDDLEVEWQDLIFKRKICGTLFLLTLVFYLASALMSALAGAFNSQVISFILFLVGFFLFIRFFFAGYFIIDKDVDLISSLQLSYHLTEGHTIRLVCLWLSTMIINLLGVFPGFFLGLVFLSLPLGLGAVAFVYRKLVVNSDLSFEEPIFLEDIDL